MDAHASGVVHRDLKPENLFDVENYVLNPHIKVLDFGISKSLSNVNLTAPGSIMGTPAYIAPEQAIGQADFRSDIFALGVILFELASGRLPYTSTTPLGHILQHIHSDPAALPAYDPEGGPQWPTPFVDTLARMMSRDPTKRPDSKDIIRDLDKALHEIEHKRPQRLE